MQQNVCMAVVMLHYQQTKTYSQSIEEVFKSRKNKTTYCILYIQRRLGEANQEQMLNSI